MPAQVTTDPLVATTNVAPVSGASVWRWLVLLPRQWATEFKIARDAEKLRTAPREILDDIGVTRSDVKFVCEYGYVPK